ncbi:leucyl aminopeptidase [Rhodobacteraceae bacterium NNCM2]|nr:leucyl aminopeptidase [Coraliihabitans acroporae]
MTTTLTPVHFSPEAETDWSQVEGILVVFLGEDGALGPVASEIDGISGGALGRCVAASDFKVKAGVVGKFSYLNGMAAKTMLLASMGEEPDRAAARKTGASIAGQLGKGKVAIATSGLGDSALVAEMICAVTLKLYDFDEYKTGDEDDKAKTPSITVYAEKPEELASKSADFAALAEGVFFTRDLVNEPANRLTTDEFAARLAAMQELGLEVEILGEPELEKMGARSLLAVGQGSDNESKIVVMKWMGGGDEAPLAVVGKGVIFDTGGISLKPAGGMEDMTMDMGGAGVVSGLMRTLALRRAKANVVGVVGLVENMPDARAQRPGDIVRSMKGDTIEVINTDAEGRLVLADALWYAQQTFKPSGVIDLATLTGAVIVALSKTRAGYFCNDDAFAAELEAACEASGDQAWRMPLGKEYHDQIKSRLADIKNTGGRDGGSCTAAAFLEVFIEEGMPWIHLDIAGVTVAKGGNELAPKGATGWGVAALDQLVKSRES